MDVEPAMSSREQRLAEPWFRLLGLLGRSDLPLFAVAPQGENCPDLFAAVAYELRFDLFWVTTGLSWERLSFGDCRALTSLRDEE